MLKNNLFEKYFKVCLLIKQELAIIKNWSLLDRYCFIVYNIETSFIKNSENVESRTMTTQHKNFILWIHYHK